MGMDNPLQKCSECGGYLLWPDEEPSALWCNCPINAPCPREQLDPSEVPNYYDSDEPELGE